MHKLQVYMQQEMAEYDGMSARWYARRSQASANSFFYESLRIVSLKDFKVCVSHGQMLLRWAVQDVSFGDHLADGQGVGVIIE